MELVGGLKSGSASWAALAAPRLRPCRRDGPGKLRFDLTFQAWHTTYNAL